MSKVIGSVDQFGFLEVRLEREDDTYVVALAGELDIDGIGRVSEALHAAEESDAREIVLDLTDLQFIDSSGIQLVVEADARSRSDGNRLRLLRGPANVHRVFVLTDLADRLPFAD